MERRDREILFYLRICRFARNDGSTLVNRGGVGRQPRRESGVASFAKDGTPLRCVPDDEHATAGCGANRFLASLETLALPVRASVTVRKVRS